MQLSPLSNIPSIGRTPIYIIGLFSFFVLQISTAVAENMQTVLILRFLAGFLGSAPISVGGATLSEIYRPSHMPYAIAFYAVSGVCGPIIGPVRVLWAFSAMPLKECS
jgi:MFS transporter, DHA1 family, multidrug resistance protein